MANNLNYDIRGFDELIAKLKKLPDAVKRGEIIKIQKRSAKPLLAAYRNELPESNKNRYRLTGARAGKRNNKLYRDRKKLAERNIFNYTGGNLKRATKIVSVPVRYTGGNPSIVIQPTSPRKMLKTKSGKTRDDAYYRFMVVAEGFKGSGRGSRVGANTVVGDARNRAYRNLSGAAIKENEVKIARYIEKQVSKIGRENSIVDQYFRDRNK